jgi:ornithine carbamoyltransferase
MFDGIEFRGFSQDAVERLAEFSGVPVWNGLTDQWHPTQMLADFLTVKEHFGHLDGITLTFCGDGRNNVANSLLVSGAKVGMNIRVFAPEQLFPEPWVIQLAEDIAANEGGGSVKVSSDPAEVIVGSDVLYTDVWVSMGEEDKFAERIALLQPFQVNRDLVEMTGKEDWIFLHCLPAFHNTQTIYGEQVKKDFGLECMEVTDDVFRSPQSKVFDEAENRLHTIKAVIAATIGKF